MRGSAPGISGASALDQLGPRRDDRLVQLVRAGRHEREQEREPERLVLHRLLGDRGVRAGELEPGVGPGERGGEALGVGGRAQAGDERVAVAVVGRAGDALGHHAGRARRWVPAAREPRDARGPRGRGGACRSAASSREQIGQFAVRRLWRQKSGTRGQLERSGSAITRDQRSGVSVTERRRMRSLCGRSGRSVTRAATARSTSLISIAANAAPTQRRTPPPNGIHA